MKKLFVSIPMKNRKPKDIKESIVKMKQFAELIEGEEMELIDSYVEDRPPKTNHEAVWYLGKAIEKLSEADVFIGITDAWDWKGCQAEKEIARNYGIKTYDMPAQYVIPDYDALIREIRCENESMNSCVPCNN